MPLATSHQKWQKHDTMARLLFVLCLLFTISADLASACTTWTSSSSVVKYDLSTATLPITIKSHDSGTTYDSNKKCWW